MRTPPAPRSPTSTPTRQAPACWPPARACCTGCASSPTTTGLRGADHEVFGSIDVEGLLLQVLAHDEEHRASILLGEPEV